MEYDHKYQAKPDENVLTEIKERWSPRSFSRKPVEHDKLKRIFEAVRWAPSSYNEQPWYFIIGINDDDTYQKISETLVKFNREWATTAPVLILAVAKRIFDKNEKNNKHYAYDTGAASAFMTLQATAEGLYMHQMAGFDEDKARELFAIKEPFQPFTAMALGYIGELSDLPEDIRKKEGENKRKPLDEIALSEWKKSFEF